MFQHERVQPGMCLHLGQPRGAFLSQAVGFFVIAFIAFCTLAVFFAAFFIAIAFRGSIQIMDPTKITQTNPQHIVAVATAIRPTSRMYIYIYISWRAYCEHGLHRFLRCCRWFPLFGFRARLHGRGTPGSARQQGRLYNTELGPCGNHRNISASKENL